jgi:hypothetical protein
MRLIILGGEKYHVHKAETLAPDLSNFDFEIAIEILKSHKSPGTCIDRIPAEIMKPGD